MTNKEFLIEVQKACHLDMPLCLSLMGSLQKVLGKAGVDLLPVAIPGLGMFTSHKHPEYVQENKATGAMTLYPPRISYRMTTEVADDAALCSELLAQFASVPEKQSSVFLDAFVSVINEHLSSGEEIDVPGIGCFQNILTHHSEMRHVSYIPCDAMKELVNAPFECFEAVVINEECGASLSEELGVVTQSPREQSSERSEEAPEEKDIPVIIPEEEAAPKEEVIEETPEQEEAPQVVVEEEKPVIPVQKVKKEEEEEKGTNRSLYISLGVILAACGFLVWLMFGDGSNLFDDPEPQEAVIVEDYTVEEAPEVSEDTVALAEVVETEMVEPEVEEPKVEEPKKEEVKPEPVKVEPKKEEPKKEEVKVEPKKEFHRMMGADGRPVTVTLKPGERLTLVALEHFGDKSFWPYIFDANADKLKAPNLVQAGMTLYLPDPAYYGIDANDAQSLQKAKNRAAQLLK